MPTQETAIVVEKGYALALWLIKKVERFPKSYRFSVGDRIVARALDLLETLLEAAYARNKQAPLERASHHINALRYLLRMAKDLGLIGAEPYGYAAEALEEIGRMTGGWRKSAQ